MNILGTGEVEEKSHEPLIEECLDPGLKPLHTRQVSVQVCGKIQCNEAREKMSLICDGEKFFYCSHICYVNQNLI